MDHPASEATGIAIAPVVKQANMTLSHPASYVERWEIGFTTVEGSFVYRGGTVVDAVEAAWANASSWR